jgi:hypothetical protein
VSWLIPEPPEFAWHVVGGVIDVPVPEQPAVLNWVAVGTPLTHEYDVDDEPKAMQPPYVMTVDGEPEHVVPE